MPALSFQEEWLDKLLSGSKQQTTRPQTNRIKVGDVCTIYNQQRQRITGKPLYPTTYDGRQIISAYIKAGKYPEETSFELDTYRTSFGLSYYYAHLLGKVKITEVYDIYPIEMSEAELTLWAMADGFDSFASARCWLADLASSA